MALTLISATPSPFARMNRIAMHEKKIDFKLQNEVPWDNTTQTPSYNPLEKLPILLFSDGREPVYDSAHVQEYLVQKYADHAPSLLTGDIDLDLKARQIVVLSEGLMDAFVLLVFEGQREVKSEEWAARQNRKLDGALRAMDELVRNRQPKGSEFLLGNVLTIADIAVVCAVGQVEFQEMRPEWKKTYPELEKWWRNLDEKENFKKTRPVMFEIKDKIV